jgi:hypothetical protein
LGQLFELRGVGESDQRGEEFRLQVSVLKASVLTAWEADGRLLAVQEFNGTLYFSTRAANAATDIRPVWHPRNCKARMRDYHG